MAYIATAALGFALGWFVGARPDLVEEGARWVATKLRRKK